MTRNFIKRGAVVAAACLAVTGAVTAVAEETPSEPAEFGPVGAEPTEAVQWAQSRRLAELRRERTAEDDLPAHWRKRLDEERGTSRWGANPSLARRVAPGVWLIPGDGFVCLANVTPRDGALGFGCAT